MKPLLTFLIMRVFCAILVTIGCCHCQYQGLNIRAEAPEEEPPEVKMYVPKHDPAGIHWQYDLKQSLSHAKATDKDLFVFLSSSWCGPCKKMERTTFRDSLVIAHSRQYVMVKVSNDIVGQEQVWDSLMNEAFQQPAVPLNISYSVWEDQWRYYPGCITRSELFISVMDQLSGRQ